MKKNKQKSGENSAQTKKLIPAKSVEIETTVINSRFIAVCAPVFSSEEARAFITSVQNEHPNANHHVPAYIIGHGSSTMAYCSDAGEPSGSAGRPILAVLQGSGFGDVVLVVSRYFGGTKLGIGGLVRAYGDAARKVLGIVPAAEILLTDTFQFDIDYALFERMKNLFAERNVEILEEVFTETIRIKAKYLSDEMIYLEDELSELSNGKINLEKLIEEQETIVPVEVLSK